METNSLKLNITTLKKDQWMSRNERGWTKVMGNLMYSAVGKDGIDVYLLKEKDDVFAIQHIE